MIHNALVLKVNITTGSKSNQIKHSQPPTEEEAASDHSTKADKTSARSDLSVCAFY